MVEMEVKAIITFYRNRYLSAIAFRSLRKVALVISGIRAGSVTATFLGCVSFYRKMYVVQP